MVQCITCNFVHNVPQFWRLPTRHRERRRLHQTLQKTIPVRCGALWCGRTRVESSYLDYPELAEARGSGVFEGNSP